MRKRGFPVRHILKPLRVLEAVAPSGGVARYAKYSESPKELSFGCGLLTGSEYALHWRAKLRAEKPGIETWDQAKQLLVDAGWTITIDDRAE